MADALRLCGIGDEAATGIDEQLEICVQLGLDGIELRTIDGAWLHQIEPGAFARVVTAVEASGLVVPVIATTIGNWDSSVERDVATDLELLDVLAERAGALGAWGLRIMSYPNTDLAPDAWREAALSRISALARRAEELDVVLLHENCAGWAGQGPDETNDLVASVAGPALRTLFDPGNCIAYGMDPLDFVSKTVDSVAHVHVKDATIPLPGEDCAFTLPFAGDAALAGCLEVLEQAGYDGWLAFEPHLAFIPHLGLADGGGLRDSFTDYVETFRRHMTGATR